MKHLLLLPPLALLSYSANAQEAYEKLSEREYHLKIKEAPAYRHLADTTKGVVHIPQSEELRVVGRVAPKWAVINRAGFIYYMAAQYVPGFSADPARDAELLAAAVPKTEEYCVLHTQGNLKGFAIQVDYGQRMRPSTKEKDESGNQLNFNSAVDALNFMNSKGWELVTVYPGTAYTGIISYPAVFYVMRRRIH